MIAIIRELELETVVSSMVVFGIKGLLESGSDTA